MKHAGKLPVEVDMEQLPHSQLSILNLHESAPAIYRYHQKDPQLDSSSSYSFSLGNDYLCHDF